MGDFTDLAVKTFSEDKKKADDHEERRAYYRELSAKEQAGKKLDDEESAWLKAARQAKVNRQADSLVDIAVKEFSSPTPVHDALVRGLNQQKDDAAYHKRLVASRERANNPSESYDPRIQSPEMLGKIEAQRLQQHGTMIGRAVGRRLMQQSDPGIAPTIRPMPNAGPKPGTVVGPSQAQLFSQATDELGRPVYDDPNLPMPTRGRGRLVLSGPDTEEGLNEKGEVVNRKGKVLGQLALPDGYRFGNRTQADVTMQDHDELAEETLKRQYGKHLDVVDEQRDGHGVPTEEFPEGYFDGMDKKTEKNIRAGVKELIRRRRGVRT